MYTKPEKAPSQTAIKHVPGRSHWHLLDPGWEEVADYALGWAVANARPAKAREEAAPMPMPAAPAPN